jgi:hypothetical protein
MCELRDVEQRLDAIVELHKGTEIRQLHHFDGVSATLLQTDAPKVCEATNRVSFCSTS